MGILVASAFAVRSTYHRTKDKIPGQLVFGRYMILLINHEADLRYIHHHKQTQINKDVNRENTTRIDHNYRVGYKVMTKIRSEYKYVTQFRGLNKIFRHGQTEHPP